MVEFPSYNVESLYEEVAERAREQGVASEDAWKELVEEILDERINWGEVDIDDDVTSMREALQEKWKQFEESVSGKPSEEL